MYIIRRCAYLQHSTPMCPFSSFSLGEETLFVVDIVMKKLKNHTMLGTRCYIYAISEEKVSKLAQICTIIIIIVLIMYVFGMIMLGGWYTMYP